jgi:MOSC domain-containing protein YiiM
MFVGEVVSIHVAPAEGEPTIAVDEIKAVAGKGLEGDRYYKLAGTFSKKEGPQREVTLIEVEALEAMERDHNIKFRLGDSRRNIVTRGVPLNHLIDEEFEVGEAVFLGIKLCHPCGYLEDMTVPGIRKALANRGGLNAQIVSGGLIRPGDAVRPVH